jgi:protein-S-isoprenylcysteine O-methyltransferase Ste14
VGVLAWTLGAVALHAAVPFQLSRLGGRARPASAPPAVRTAGLVTVAAGGALMAWAFAAHYREAPQGWLLESGLMPGYLLRQGPYQLIRNPMYAGEAIVWAGWGLVYASPAVWAGLAIMCTGLAATVRWEERRLLRRFGDNYQAYLAEVPRWVPGSASAKGPGVAVFGAIFHGSPASGLDQPGTGPALCFRSCRRSRVCLLLAGFSRGGCGA